MVECPNNDEYLWIKKGKSYSNRKKYEEAIECYNKAIEINPSNPQACFEKSLFCSNVFDCDEFFI